jgi:hypothetical protein
VGEVVGAIRQDRLNGVLGRLGAVAPTVALEVTVVRPEQKPRRANFELLRHRSWTPILVRVLVATAIFDAQAHEASESYRISGTLDLAGGKELALDLLVPNPEESSSAVFRAAGEVARRVGLAIDTPFGQNQASSLVLRVEPVPGAAAAMVEDVSVRDTRVRPGETVVLTLYLRGADGQRRAMPLELEVPRGIRPGPLELHVGSEAGLEASFGQPAEARRRSARDEGAWLDAVASLPRDHLLVARLARPSGGVVLRGQLYSSLPPSVARTLTARPGGAQGYRLRRAVLAERREEIDVSLSGSRMVRLDVVEERAGGSQ